MNVSKQSAFANATVKADSWIDEIDRRLRWNDKQRSLRALRGVLHALRDRLTVEENAQLSAQLPLVVRGVFFENWRPGAAARHTSTLAEFLAEIHRCLPEITEAESKRTAQIVCDVLALHVSEGEIADVGAILPSEIREFWNVAVS